MGVNWQFGDANMDGKQGSCCMEIDLWEANMHAKSYTGHTCPQTGAYSCADTACDKAANKCDAAGCDYNEYRLGAAYFYGDGGLSLDARKPFTVVTQFLTDDSKDTGDLSKIHQFYIQDGKRIDNPVAGVGGDLSDAYCTAMEKAFGAKNSSFVIGGGMKKLGQALDAGMVLAVSIWDDSQTNMRWLDSDYPNGVDPYTNAGVRRGPCASTATKAELDQANEGAYVRFSNIRYGEVTSTAYPYTAGTARLFGLAMPSVGSSVLQGTVAAMMSLLVLGGVAMVAVRRRMNANLQGDASPILENDGQLE